MRITHLLIAALIALPVALTGCDAGAPDGAEPLTTATPATQAEAKAAGEKSGGPITGPETLNVGSTATYSMYGATTLRVKQLSGSVDVLQEWSENDEGGIPTLYISIRGVSAGNIQIEGYHPNFGWSYKTVIVLDPNTDPCPNGAGNVAGPSSVDLNGYAHYSATCADRIVAARRTQGRVQVVDPGEVVIDPNGRPTIRIRVKGTASGATFLRAKLGSDTGSRRNITVNEPPPPPTCDLSYSTVNGIYGPNAIRFGSLGEYSSYESIGFRTKDLSGAVTVEAEGDDGGIPPTSYVVVRGTRAGNAQITADYVDGSASRTIQICPGRFEGEF